MHQSPGTIRPERLRYRAGRAVACWLVVWLTLAGTALGLPGLCRPAAAGAAAELTVRPLAREVRQDRVIFIYDLGMNGVVSVRNELRDGAHMLVEGSISLLRERTFRPNEVLTRIPLEWLIRNDPLTREFSVSDAEQYTARGPHLDTVLHDAWRRLRQELVPTEPLEADETYLIHLELVLRYAKVPPWLERALFFWSWELSPPLVYDESFVFTPADAQPSAAP